MEDNNYYYLNQEYPRPENYYVLNRPVNPLFTVNKIKETPVYPPSEVNITDFANFTEKGEDYKIYQLPLQTLKPGTFLRSQEVLVNQYNCINY